MVCDSAWVGLEHMQQLAGIRNRVVHGRADVAAIRPEMIAEINNMTKELKEVLDAPLGEL